MNKTRKNLTKFALLIVLLSGNQLFAQKAFGPTPSKAQLAWHEMEFYAFVHFNMNTFTGREWGTGGESPEEFNPTNLDCRQWAKIFKDAGMKGIILTAKHHDGFCLWPTKTTEHSVKNSPWKNGKGDVVKELSEACKEYGLKFGVYLSPWDRNNAAYGTPEYIDVFRGQLRELLTNYGDVFEVWFDGANGGSGYYGGANETRKIDGRTYYGWDETWAIVNELQPNAMIFGDGGPTVRWVGTEQGWANKTNWSLLRREEVWPGWPHYKQLRSGHEDGTHWVPAEVDVSIRPGWYYHKSEDHKVKSLPRLLDIYYQSIGRNGSLLLNVPPDRRGLINENDVKALMEFSKAIKSDFAHELAKGQKVSASNVRENSVKFSTNKVNDGNKETYWATNDGVTDASLIIEFDKIVSFNRFLVQEYIRLGQRVKAFTLEAFVNKKWKLLATETTIGYKRILRLPTTKTDKIRFHIKDAKACPLISNIEIYHAHKVLSTPKIERTKAGVVSIIPSDTGLETYYTFDGTDPDKNSLKYTKPFVLKNKAQLKVICIDPETKSNSLIESIDFDICKEKWKVIYPKSKKKKANAVIDDNKENSWYIKAKEIPVELIIDLGEKLKLSGFTYLPDQSRWAGGYIFKYEFYVSSDGKKWDKAVSKGEFSNINNNPVLQKKVFETKKGRYIKLKALSEANGEKRIGFAEIGIITE